MARTDIYRAIDKLDRLGPLAVWNLLTVGNTDKSGDPTQGCDLTYDQARFVMIAIGAWPAQADAYVVQLRQANGC